MSEVVNPIPMNEDMADVKEENDEDKEYASESEAILEDMKQLNVDKMKVPNTSVSTTSKPTVIEDFLRNFLISNEMHESLDVFQREWYNKLQREDEITAISKIPDIYVQKERLESKVKYLQENLDRMESITEKVKNTWDNLRKERDYHRMHHRRVLQEKNELIKQLKRLKKYCDAYEPTICALKVKYENAKKEKMLFRIDRDKMAVKLDAMEEQIKQIQENYIQSHDAQNIENKKSMKNNKKSRSKLSTKSLRPLSNTAKSGISVFPKFSTTNPYLSQNEEDIDTVNVEKFALKDTFSVHKHAVSKIALHPSKDIVATASDDMTWKLWNLPSESIN